MIAPSEFNSLAARGLAPVTLAVQEKYNGENVEPQYYHRRFFSPKYSFDGTYNALTVYNRKIVADVVSLDSSIPLKSRASVGSAKGDLPKIATERNLNESELRQLQLMMRADSDELTIMRMFFQDVDNCYAGILEQRENLGLQALSSGAILVDENTNVGAGIRVDFGYLAANKFAATIIWGQANYTPITDLLKLYDKSVVDGTPIRRFLMRRAQLQQIISSTEARNLFANAQGMSSVSFNPTVDQLNGALLSTYGFELEAIERTVTFEKNGVAITANPWAAGQIIGLQNDQVGSLVWSDVVEASNPVGGVDYAVADNGILLKQYRLVRPSLKQVTASEAVCLPVVSGVNAIYKLDTTAITV